MSKKSVVCLSVGITLWSAMQVPVWANGSLGDSGMTSLESGSFQFGLDVQKTFSNRLDFKATTGSISNTTGGGYDGRVTLLKDDASLTSEALFARGVFAIAKGIAIFGNIGTKRIDNDNYITSDPGFTGALGVRFVPEQSSPIKVGITLKGSMDRVSGTRDNRGLSLSNNKVNGSVSFSGNGASKDKLSTNRIDALLDFGVDTAYVRPYLGVLFTYIYGDYSSVLSGTATVTDCVYSPTYSCTNTDTPFVYSQSRKVINDAMIGGVLGVSVNQHESIGFNLEYHYLPKVDQSLIGSVVVRF